MVGLRARYGRLGPSTRRLRGRSSRLRMTERSSMRVVRSAVESGTVASSSANGRLSIGTGALVAVAKSAMQVVKSSRQAAKSSRQAAKSSEVFQVDPVKIPRGRMRVRLDDRWVERLLRVGVWYGLSACGRWFLDGRKLNDVSVFNAEEIELPAEFAPLRPLPCWSRTAEPNAIALYRRPARLRGCNRD